MSKVRQICPVCAACNTKQKDGYYMCCGCRHKWKDVKSSSVFDHITESVEKLAEKFVYKTQRFFYDDNHKPIPNHTYYVSQLLVSEKTGRSIYFENEEDAIAATIKELKKEVEE